MSDMKKLGLDALDEVVGGAVVYVQNDAVDYANIRMEPGLDSLVLAKVKNGTKLITTGPKVKKDGYIWYQVVLATGSDPGWIAGSLIGF